MSRKGPAAIPAGFHHVALLSVATPTNAPPMPGARPPATSMACARRSSGQKVTVIRRLVARKTRRKLRIRLLSPGPARIVTGVTLTSRRKNRGTERKGLRIRSLCDDAPPHRCGPRCRFDTNRSVSRDSNRRDDPPPTVHLPSGGGSPEVGGPPVCDDLHQRGIGSRLHAVSRR